MYLVVFVAIVDAAVAAVFGAIVDAAVAAVFVVEGEGVFYI